MMNNFEVDNSANLVNSTEKNVQSLEKSLSILDLTTPKNRANKLRKYRQILELGGYIGC